MCICVYVYMCICVFLRATDTILAETMLADLRARVAPLRTYTYFLTGTC